MKLNKEKSLEFVSVVRKPKLILNDVGNNVSITRKFELILKNIKTDKVRVFIAKQNFNYFKNVHDADMSQFNTEFVNLYREGTVEIQNNGKNYKIENLYIKAGIQNGVPRIHLVDVLEASVDIITGEKIENFEKKHFMPFRFSKCFYEIYNLYKEKDLLKDNKLVITNEIAQDIFDILGTFDATRHDKTPETYYYDKRA